MKGSPIDGPIRDCSPCKTCTDERHTACHDTCEKYKRWSDKVEQANKNRREYAQKRDFQWRKK